MDSTLTKDAAQRRIFEHFTMTLGGMPAELSLTTMAPHPGMGNQDPGFTVPCDDSDQSGGGPVNLQVSLWVKGVPEGQERRYFDMFSQAFEQNGWTLKRDDTGPLRITRGFTGDGYAVVARLNPVGGLSLTGSSPCFPKANDHSTAPQPSTVPHP